MSAPTGRIGARVKRGDDPRLLTGRGRYVDDLSLPRMVHAAFVRSPHAHARLVHVDLERAGRAPGVVGVLAGDAVAKLCKPYRGVLLHYKGMKTGAMLPLAIGRVRCVGEPIVAIAAESRAAADDAAALIDIEYEPIPAVLSATEALADGAPVIHPELGDNVLYETRITTGDVGRAFAGAARVWERTFTTGRHTGVPLEPRSLLADYEPATRSLTVWISTQVPHMMQAVLAELFALREPRVRVVAPDVGGSFGIKIHVYQDDMAACALAVTLGRPVKWVASRRESFVSDIHAREQTIRVELAADDAGVLTAMRASITAAVGPYSAYPRSSVVEGGQVLRLLPGPYRVRSYDARAARGGTEQGRHLAIPRCRASDRHRGDREHDRPGRARPRDRSGGGTAPKPDSPGGSSLHDRRRKRPRQRQLSRSARAAARGRRLRPATPGSAGRA